MQFARTASIAKGMGRDEACQFLTGNAAAQFDPNVVEAFLANLVTYENEIAAYRSSQQPLLTPTTQAGLSESARSAVPAAGLAQTATDTPDYVKQIHAAHAEVAALYEMAQTFSASLDVQDVVTLTVNRVGRGIAGWVVINGRPMSNTDPMLDLNEFLGSNETGYRTAAVFPLTERGETIGALALYTSELDSYNNDHLH